MADRTVNVTNPPRRGESRRRPGRRTGALALALAALMALLAADPAPAADAPEAAPTAAPALDRPNIVFVLTDDQTYESLDVAMPYLSSRPGGDWITFTDAVVNTANCCPSRATILTGQYSDAHGVTRNDLGARLDDDHTVAAWLDGAGYETALIGKYLNDYPWNRPTSYIPPGWDRWWVYDDQSSPQDGTGYVLNENGTSVFYPKRNRNYTTDVYRDHAVDFIDTAPEPFFVTISTKAPHAPFESARRHRDAFDDLEVVHPPNFNEADVSDKPRWVQALPLLSPREEQRQAIDRVRAYRAILAIDEAVEQITDAVDRRGVLDRTVIVFMSDNNLSFGSHRWKQKKVCPYEECIHVPLMIRYPGAGNGTVGDVVSNADLASTFAELAGTSPDIAQDGHSLVPLLRGEPSARPGAVLIAKPPPDDRPWASLLPSARPAEADPTGGPRSDGYGVTNYYGLRTRRWTYVEYQNGERELYDLRRDPHQLDNLAEDPAYADRVTRLSRRLDRMRP